MPPSPFTGFCRWYRQSVIAWINFVLGWPRTVLLAPMVVVFLLAYPVVFEFSIKQINASIARQFGGCPPVVYTDLDSLYHRDVSQDWLYRVEGEAQNVFSESALKEVELWSQQVVSNDSSAVIIQPLFTWRSSTPMSSLMALKFINYIMPSALTAMFFDHISETNHLITMAKTLNVYVLTSLQELPLLESFKVVQVTQSSKDIRKLVDFYCAHAGYPTWHNIVYSGLTWMVTVALIGYYLYIYLALSNRHQIYSVVSVLVCWIAETALVAASAIGVVTWMHGFQRWQQVFEPSTSFNRIAYLFMVTIISSCHLFGLIDRFSASDDPVHHRLFRFYTSSRPSQAMLGQLFRLTMTFVVGKIALSTYIPSEFYTFTTSRFLRLVESLIVAVVVDYVLTLTYMVVVLVVDSSRARAAKEAPLVRLADSDDDDEPEDDDLDIMDSTNMVSRFFSKRNRKLSQWLLKVGFSDDEVMKSVVSIVLILLTFYQWLSVVPYTGEKRVPLVTLGSSQILESRYSLLYYLELASVLTLILALALILYKLIIPSIVAEPVTAKDFTKDSKIFNSIVLNQPAHTLDIILIKANSHTSFIVSMGLDHQLFIWSPLSPESVPINIATTFESTPSLVESSGRSQSPSRGFDPTLPPVGTPFWPINSVNISDDGNYIILINFKHGVIKCYERKQLRYSWEQPLPHDISKALSGVAPRAKIVESFFRRKTVPGFLARKILQKKKGTKKSVPSASSQSSRRGSAVSLTSMNSAINGNFPVTPTDDLRELQKTEFIFVLDSGQMVVISCSDGQMKQQNILALTFGPDYPEDYRLVSVKRMVTPRVNDRIVCQVNNHSDFIIATVVNNNWKIRKMAVREGHYNQALINTGYVLPMAPRPMPNQNDFSAIYKEQVAVLPPVIRDSAIQINRPTIVTVEFVGMIVRVKNMSAEIIDVQTAIILKTFNVGRFKPSSFKVCHSEPTHCKFCGCASIQSLSIVYEDYDSPMIIMHTFTIDIPRSKNYICLRVERDPREIRCIGFNAATEHQYWYDNIAGWELTDVNMIIGLRQRSPPPEEDEAPAASSGLEQLMHSTTLKSLRHRHHQRPKSEDRGEWEGFIITASDGNVINYTIPKDTPLASPRAPDISCIAKYGYKSVIVNVGASLQILYLGNDKLVEDDIYYSGNQADVWSILEDQAGKGIPQRYTSPRPNQTINSELLFINKRARNRDKNREPV